MTDSAPSPTSTVPNRLIELFAGFTLISRAISLFPFFLSHHAQNRKYAPDTRGILTIKDVNTSVNQRHAVDVKGTILSIVTLNQQWQREEKLINEESKDGPITIKPR